MLNSEESQDNEPPNQVGSFCQSQVSRNAAYGLLIDVCRFCPTATPYIISAVLSSTGSTMTNRTLSWDYDPRELMKSPTPYVGLKNQGATCYMNSLLQQLFHVPEFSTGLMQIESQDLHREESVLFQLQVFPPISI